MLSPARLKLKELFGALVVLALAPVALLLALGQSPVQAFSNVGLILTLVVYPSWVFFERIGWRQPLFRLGGYLSAHPDLRGRWEGTLDRFGEEKPHRFVIEIRQTYTSIRVDTYSSRGHSHSLTANLLADSDMQVFQLAYTWVANAGKLEDEEFPPGMFYGTTILDLLGPDRKTLRGHYFTNRMPEQTRGTIDLKHTTTALRSSFE